MCTVRTKTKSCAAPAHTGLRPEDSGTAGHNKPLHLLYRILYGSQGALFLYYIAHCVCLEIMRGGRGRGRGRGRSAPGAGQVLLRETQMDLGMDKFGPDQVRRVYIIGDSFRALVIKIM